MKGAAKESMLMEALHGRRSCRERRHRRFGSSYRKEYAPCTIKIQQIWHDVCLCFVCYLQCRGAGNKAARCELLPDIRSMLIDHCAAPLSGGIAGIGFVESEGAFRAFG